MAEIVRRVRPTPVDTYLGNPHKGCCTFQHFNGDELFPGTSWSESGPTEFPAPKAKVIDGYLPTTVAYCRWFWETLEPTQGKYDFSVIEKSLQACKERGQTLAVRLMAFGSSRQPQVPDWYAKKYPMIEEHHKSLILKTPDHDSKEYLEHWGNTIREFAKRYDGHPLLETIDVTYIGPWGEGAGKCSPAQCKRFAELWRDAFKHTPRLGMLGGDQMKAAIATGSGWRADCFGDVKMTGSHEVRRDLSWNHHYEAYPQEVYEGGATDAWKSAPVHWESCWVPMHWYNEGYDLDFILEQGLKYHATYFMPKYTRLPEKWMDKLSAFCRKLGYRYIYRNSKIDARVSVGGKFKFESWIENVGVAPIYRPYDFALRLRQGDTEDVVVLPGVDIRTWLPGDAIINTHVALPAKIQRGWAELDVGLVDPKERTVARVSFANKENYSDRWLSLGGIEVV